MKVWLLCVSVSLNLSHLRVCWASWMFIFMFFMKYGEFSLIKYYFLKILSLPLPFSPSETLKLHMLVCVMVSHRSLSVCSLFFSLLVIFCSSDLIISMSYLKDCSFFLLLAQICRFEFLWIPSGIFISVILIFSSTISFWFLFRFFFSLLIISILFWHHFLDFLHFLL